MKRANKPKKTSKRAVNAIHKTLKKEMKQRGRFIFVIPVYNHEARIAHVVKTAKSQKIPVLIIDDGSTDLSYENIKNIKNITIIKHPRNLGKGAAIKTAMEFVVEKDLSDWIITIDADGQHNPEDVVNLVSAIPENQRPIVVGRRVDMVGRDVPWTSRFGRGFSNFWVWLSGGPRISDSQSGFRIYPVPECSLLRVKANRFQFEVEILAKANWKRIPVIEAPISVSYTPGTERISHFKPFIDFCRNSTAFTRLIVQRILIPAFLRRKIF